MSSPLASLAESRIQEALEAGEDRGLSGHGQPLDLEGYFAAPSSLRAGFGLLKSANTAPPEVDAMREIAHLRDRLAKAADTPSRHGLIQELRQRELELAMGLERMKRSIKADAAAWE